MQKDSTSRNGLEGVAIDRTTRFGNPFKVGGFYTSRKIYKDGFPLEHYFSKEPQSGWQKIEDAETAIKLYDDWLKMKLRFAPYFLWNNLQDKNLYCFCHEDDPCHGDVILKHMGFHTTYKNREVKKFWER